MATMNLDALRVFAAVAQARSFTQAARQLDLDKSHASRIVRALEERLGVTLLVRTTRSVRPTPEGEQLLARIALPVATLDAALASSPDMARPLAGTVSLTTTAELGRAWLAPAVVALRAAHPAIELRVVLTQDRVDVAAGAVDLALRVGDRLAGSVVARRLFALEAGFFAAPAYLARRGRPADPAELAAHETLWPPVQRGRRTFAPARRPPRASITADDFAFLAAVARAGGGIALLPALLAAPEVAAGALVRVLPQVRFAGAPVYLVSRPPRTLAPRVLAVRDHLLAHARGA